MVTLISGIGGVGALIALVVVVLGIAAAIMTFERGRARKVERDVGDIDDMERHQPPPEAGPDAGTGGGARR